MRYGCVLLVLLATIAAAGNAPAFAQGAQGQSGPSVGKLLITVVDQTGGVLPNATVKVTPQDSATVKAVEGQPPPLSTAATAAGVATLENLPPGCAFNPRCPDRFDPCTTSPPPDYPAGAAQTAKCYLHGPQFDRR